MAVHGGRTGVHGIDPMDPSAKDWKKSSVERPARCFYGYVILLACILSKLVKIQGQNNIMSYTVPHLLADWGLTHGELGACFSAGTVLAACFQPFFGRLVDRYGA